MEFERINSFLESFAEDDRDGLKDIYKEAQENGVPVIRKNTKELLRLLILIAWPKRILEVGTAVGYSALIMDEAQKMAAGTIGAADKAFGVVGADDICDSGCKDDSAQSLEIITIELDDKRADEAQGNFEAILGSKDAIKLLRGDAYQVMKDMTVEEYGLFDMVFIDAAKAQYSGYFEEAMRLTKKGSIIICDNILSGGEILESHFLVEKRNRTIHDRMRSFLKEIKDDKRIYTALLSVGDGMSVSVRLS